MAGRPRRRGPGVRADRGWCSRRSWLVLCVVLLVVTISHLLVELQSGDHADLSEALQADMLAAGLAIKPLVKFVKESMLGIGKRPANYAHFLRDFVFRSFLRDYPNAVRVPSWAIEREPSYFRHLSKTAHVKLVPMKEGTRAYQKLYEWKALHEQYGFLLTKQGDEYPELKARFSFFPFFRRDNHTAPRRVVYISRRNSARRRFTPDSEELLLQTLRSHEPALEDVLITSHWSLMDQARLFTEARVFVTLHGAALANILYMPPGSHVVEIMPPNYTKPTFKNLAKLTGVRYTRVMIEHSKHSCGAVAIRCEAAELRDVVVDLGKQDIHSIVAAVLERRRR